jgi:hypothetical protein
MSEYGLVRVDKVFALSQELTMQQILEHYASNGQDNVHACHAQ